MSVKESLERVLGELPEGRLREVLDFAEFLSWREENEAWRSFGQSQLAKAYGVDEPEYTIADVRPEGQPGTPAMWC